MLKRDIAFVENQGGFSSVHFLPWLIDLSSINFQNTIDGILMKPIVNIFSHIIFDCSGRF